MKYQLGVKLIWGMPKDLQHQAKITETIQSAFGEHIWPTFSPGDVVKCEVNGTVFGLVEVTDTLYGFIQLRFAAKKPLEQRINQIVEEVIQKIKEITKGKE